MSKWCSICGQWHDDNCGNCGGTPQFPDPKPMIEEQAKIIMSAAIAARDKEWVDKLDAMFMNPEWQPDDHCNCENIIFRLSQQLKKDMGL